MAAYLGVTGVEWVGSWVRVRGLLRFSPCELLLLDAGSWGTGTVRKPRIWETPAAGSRYQATTGEDTADWEDLVCAVLNCRMCEWAIALLLLAVPICKSSINPITNPNPLYSHNHTPDSMIKLKAKLSLGLIKRTPGHEEVWGSGDTAQPFLTSALDGGLWSASRPWHCDTRETSRRIYCMWGWVDSRVYLDIMEKKERRKPVTPDRNRTPTSRSFNL
jgi:hypothetical protein